MHIPCIYHAYHTYHTMHGVHDMYGFMIRAELKWYHIYLYTPFVSFSVEHVGYWQWTLPQDHANWRETMPLGRTSREAAQRCCWLREIWLRTTRCPAPEARRTRFENGHGAATKGSTELGVEAETHLQAVTSAGTKTASDGGWNKMVRSRRQRNQGGHMCMWKLAFSGGSIHFLTSAYWLPIPVGKF